MKLCLIRIVILTFFCISRLLGADVSLSDALQISIDNTKQGVLKRDLNKAYILLKDGNDYWAENLSILKPTQKTPLRASKSKKHTGTVY